MIAFTRGSQRCETLAGNRNHQTEDLPIDEPPNLWADKTGIEHILAREFNPIEETQ